MDVDPPPSETAAQTALGKRLLVGNIAGAITQWDVETGQPIAGTAEPVTAVNVVRYS